MAISLQGPTTADFKYTVDLEGQAYDIRWRWNSRSESWFLYIGFAGRQYVLKTRVTTNWNLLNNYSTVEGLPPGSLYLVDIEKSYGRPSFDNVGIDKRFQLIYFRSTEDDPFLSI